MGRKKTNPVGQLFFKYDRVNNISTCKVEGCLRSILKGNHSNNLETHIRSYHTHEYTILIEAKNKSVEVKQNDNSQTNDNSTIFSLKVNFFIKHLVILMP